MKKSVYFIIQIIWSLIAASLIWYFTLANVTIDDNGNGNAGMAGIVFVIGFFAYLTLSIMYILMGTKWIKDWHLWMPIVNILIGAAMAIAGAFAAIYIPELLHIGI